jgi:ribosomal protein S18 acetylase RimI-like enzyme
VTLRRVSKSELEAVRALRVQAARWLWDRGIHQWNPEGFTDEDTRDDFECHRLYGLWDGEALVGSFRLQDGDPVIWPEAVPGEALYLHCLVVARDRAGEGLGERLLGEAMAIVAAEKRRFLRLDCWAGNDTLRRYYKSSGFLPRGEITEAEWQVARFERLVS